MSAVMRQDLVAPPHAAGADPVARATDLAVTFRRNGRRVQALRGVSLEIAPAEIVGLVGESGSGKTVLGLSMLGLLPRHPSPEVSGSLVVDGVDMVHAREEQRRQLRRRLGAIFQDPMTSLNPTMRVGRQIEEKAGNRAEALRLLDAVGVPAAAQRLSAYPHELSGGLRQRVMIAMAIAGGPKLVVADEPTTALDVTVQAQILQLLRDLRDELGVSFLFVTHDLGVAAEVADRIVVAYAGRVAEVGPAQALLQRPAHPYTVGLLASRLAMDSPRNRPLPTLAGELPDPTAPPAGCPFAPRCRVATSACTDGPPPLVPVSHSGVAACIHTDVALASLEETPPWPATVKPMSSFALECVDVKRSFSIGEFRHRRELQALRGVDLRVAPGEAVALVGESGCGKSTLLRAIAGLLSVDGDVALRQGARPQMVFQDAGASLTPWLSVGELIGERLLEERLSRKQRRAKVVDALRLVGLPADVASVKPAQLSGGQRQRVALARAVVVPPTVLLCDEPTSALDVSLAAVVLNLLGRLRRELDMSMLFVTHDLAAARLVADRVAVMYLGRIVEDLPAADLAGADHPYTQALLAAVPGTGVVRAAAVGEPPSPLDPPSGCSYHPRCPAAVERCRERRHHEVPVSDVHLVDCIHAQPEEVPA